MFKWFSIFCFFASGKYQNKEKPLKRQRKLGLVLLVNKTSTNSLIFYFDKAKQKKNVCSG